jgi:predicted ATPase
MTEFSGAIHTPDRRLRVFISSTLGELAAERRAIRTAVESMRMTPIMFELGARPHPPRDLYRAYLDQSDVLVGVYWQRYGWVAPGEAVSGLEDEYRLAGERPRLLYIKEPAPVREDRLDTLIRAFGTDARASYKRFQTVDELYELVADDLAVLLTERFGSPEAATDDGSAIPAAPNPLLGRDTEVCAVLAQLGAGARLVTLTGIGGIGKTRLALEVARRQSAYVETYVVLLAATFDVDEALPAIATQLRARAVHTEVREAIRRRLDGRATFLVLDNVEQINGFAVAIAGLLEALPDLQILVTSRRNLHVQAEEIVAVSSLRVPSIASSHSDKVTDSPAVQLFLDRARRAGAALDGSDATLAAVAEIAHRVDGIPLALELAASRVRVLGPFELLERLRDRLSILTGGTADLPERQRSLRATLQWSDELLTRPARVLLARTSVFVGGWTLAAAEAICQSPDLDVTDALGALVDASVVSVDTGSGVPRFEMLETIREYAAGRLEALGATELIADAHLDFHLALGREAQPFLCGPGQHEWLIRLDAERPNMRAAVDRAMASGRYADVIDFAWDVIVLYFVRDAVHEPAGWLSAVREAQPSLDPMLDAKLRSLHALTRIHRGDHVDVERDLIEPLATFEAAGMTFEAAVTLHQLGFAYIANDDESETAIAALRRSSQLFDSVAHDWGVALAEAMLGSIFAAQGNFPDAEACQQRSLDRARRIDNEPLVVQALQHLAFIRLLDADEGAALELLEQSAPLLRRNELRTEAAYCLDELGLIALIGGDTEVAARAVSVAAAERSRLDVAPWPSLAASIAKVGRAAARRLGPDRFALLAEAAGTQDLFATLDAVRSAVAARRRHRSPAPFVEDG